jgi:hypothetical protein
MIDGVSVVAAKILFTVIASERNVFCISAYKTSNYVFVLFSHARIEKPFLLGRVSS